MIRHLASQEPYYRRRLAEIRELPEPPRSLIRTLNARYHYAIRAYRAPFDVFWHPKTGAFHLRITVGRRKLPVLPDALHVGRYDRASSWAEVKADFLAIKRED